MKRAELIIKLKEIFADKLLCCISREHTKNILIKNNIKFSDRDIDKLLKIFCGSNDFVPELELKRFLDFRLACKLKEKRDLDTGFSR